MPKKIKCPYCKNGKVMVGNPQEDDGQYEMNCHVCKGKGWFYDRRKDSTDANQNV